MLENILGPVLGIVIGASFVYFMLSIICSSIQELIASIGRWRAHDLEAALVLMLGPSWMQALSTHPLINAMGTKPPYIPSRTFALAMFDLYAPTTEGALTLGRLRENLKATAVT